MSALCPLPPPNIDPVKDSQEFEQFMSSLEAEYAQQVLTLRESLCEDLSHKYNLVYALCTQGYYDDKEHVLLSMLQIIHPTQRKREASDNPDFAITPLLRVLYAEEKNTHAQSDDTYENVPCDATRFSLSEAKALILQNLAHYQFWPVELTEGNNNNKSRNGKHSHPHSHPNSALEHITFWSENHLLMTLGSAYLLQEYLRNSYSSAGSPLFPISSAERICESIEKAHIKELLSLYLAVHLDPNFQGFYEVHSVVYLQFTIYALLNLVDFARDRDIADQARALLDIIVEQIMQCTDPCFGVANLAASARHYSRVAERNSGFALNTLVKLMNRGHSCEPFAPTYLSAALALTETWKPPRSAFVALCKERNVVSSRRYSHSLATLCNSYDRALLLSQFAHLPRESVTPLLWSAGVLFHPNTVVRNFHFVKSRGLAELNKDLRAFTEQPTRLSGIKLSPRLLTAASRTFSHFTRGQIYTDVFTNVYKSPRHGLVMSSLDMFNPHYCGFQQLPWMVNLAGVPIYSQSGHGKVVLELKLNLPGNKNKTKQALFSHSSTNTHNPAVKQQGDLLLVSYLSHDMSDGLSREKQPSLRSLAWNAVKKRVNVHVHFFWPRRFFEEEKDFPYSGSHFNVEELHILSEKERKGDEECSKDMEAAADLKEEKKEDSIDEEDELRAFELLNVDAADSDSEEEYQECQQEIEEIADEDEREEEEEVGVEESPIAPAVDTVDHSDNVPQQGQQKKSKKKANALVRNWNAFSKSAQKTAKQVEKAIVKGSHQIAQDVSSAASSVQQSLRIKKRRRNPQKKNEDTSPEREDWHWSVGRRGDCFVAFLSSKKLLESDAEVTQKVFTLDGETKPLTTFLCRARQVSFVVFVGTTEEYASIDDFFAKKLRHIVVVEYVKDFEYNIVVNDTTEECRMIRYHRNALNPL